jgi:hypothetical protein
MSSRFQIITTLGWDRTSIKNSESFEEALDFFQKIKEKHKNDSGFYEYNSGHGFKSAAVVCELVDNEVEINYEAFKKLPQKNRTEKPLVYLASTYTHEDPKIKEYRWIKICEKASQLASEGMMVFSPIAMCHPMSVFGKLPGDWTFWEKFDRAYLSCSNKMIVYKLKGWETSKGVQSEIKIAEEMGIPIEYIDEDL